MAYSTGVSSSPDDLAAKIATFMLAHGWTSNYAGADPDGLGYRFHAHRGGIYVNLRAAKNEEVVQFQGQINAGIVFYLGTGYSGGSTKWDQMAGGPFGAGASPRLFGAMRLPGGATIAYHLFADSSGDNIAVVVETVAGVFTHMGLGTSLTKAGGWTGGEYMFGSTAGYANLNQTGSYPGQGLTAETPFGYDPSIAAAKSFVRADVDSFTGKWVALSGNAFGSSNGLTGKQILPAVYFPGLNLDPIPNYQGFQERQTSALNGAANLLPLRLYAERDVGGFSLLGSVPQVFYCNGVGHGFAAGSTYALGSDNYVLFPNFAVKKV